MVSLAFSVSYSHFSSVRDAPRFNRAPPLIHAFISPPRLSLYLISTLSTDSEDRAASFWVSVSIWLCRAAWFCWGSLWWGLKEGGERLLSFLAQHGSKCTMNSLRVGLEAKAILSATTLLFRIQVQLWMKWVKKENARPLGDLNGVLDGPPAEAL